MVNVRKKYRNSENGGISSNKGFTLVELLVVLVIIGILAAIGISSFTGFRNNAKSARAMGEIKELERGIIAHVLEKGAYPAVATWLTDINREGILDPWGQPYVYAVAGTRFLGVDKNTDFDLYSKGIDGDSDPDLLNSKSADDIIRFSDGAYIGLKSKF